MTCVHRRLFLEPCVGSVPPKATWQNGGCVEFVVRGEDGAQRGECGSNQPVPHTPAAHALVLLCLKRFFFQQASNSQDYFRQSDILQNHMASFTRSTWEIQIYKTVAYFNNSIPRLGTTVEGRLWHRVGAAFLPNEALCQSNFWFMLTGL